MPHRPPTPSPFPRAPRLRLDYLYGGVVTYRPGETLAARVLTDFEFVLLQAGSAEYLADGQLRPLRAGSAVLARPGFREFFQWDRRMQTRHAYFHFGLAAIPADWPEPFEWPVHRPNCTLAVQSLCGEILALAHHHPGGVSNPPDRLIALLVEALLGLFLNPPAGMQGDDQAPRPESAARALKWMREILDGDPGRPVTLAELARAGGVSAKHLCRVFAASIGHSPMETLRLLRLQLASALLARSNLSVGDIARRCGFDDPLYFSRCFSAAYGLSPRAMRERMQKGIPPPATPLPADLMPRLHW
jgi:AraC family transcriptional regulator